MNNKKKSLRILLVGGTGLVGTQLASILKKKGYIVSYLSRSKGYINGDIKYQWSIEKEYIDPEAIKNNDIIIHLAGAGVADKRWTKERKQIILESRTKSTQLLNDSVKKHGSHIKKVICANAIGYYGISLSQDLLDETSLAGTDFLAKVCVDWEKSSDRLIDTIGNGMKIRVGVVMTSKGGALPKMAKPIQFGVGAAIGTGKQIISWIHIEDLCNMFVFGIENISLQGVFNGVSPHPVDNTEMTQTIAKVLQRPLFLPNIPWVVLHLALGEMSQIVIRGSKVSAKKIIEAGFKFKFIAIEQALSSIYKNKE